MNRISAITAADWGHALHRGAHRVGIIAALVITCSLLAGGLAFELGRQLRLAIEALNDQLAAWWVAVLGLTPAAAPAAPAPAPAPAPVAPTLPLQEAPAPFALLPAGAPVVTARKAPAKPRTRRPAAPKAPATLKPTPKPAAAPRKASRRKVAV